MPPGFLESLKALIPLKTRSHVALAIAFSLPLILPNIFGLKTENLQYRLIFEIVVLFFGALALGEIFVLIHTHVQKKRKLEASKELIRNYLAKLSPEEASIVLQIVKNKNKPTYFRFNNQVIAELRHANILKYIKGLERESDSAYIIPPWLFQEITKKPSMIETVF